MNWTDWVAVLLVVAVLWVAIGAGVSIVGLIGRELDWRVRNWQRTRRARRRMGEVHALFAGDVAAIDKLACPHPVEARTAEDGEAFSICTRCGAAIPVRITLQRLEATRDAILRSGAEPRPPLPLSPRQVRRRRRKR